MNDLNGKSWLGLALCWSVVRRSLGYAFVVGTVLILINHGEAILQGEVNTNRIVRMGLTVMVPYVVSTLSSVGAMRTLAKCAANG